MSRIRTNVARLDPSAVKPEDALKSDSIPKAEPLAPPPRPDPSDYFSAAHGHLSTETNPFEYSFAGGQSGANGTEPAQTPGGTKLPSLSALTSPGGLLGNPYWSSLRSGPLSPAMLSGPAKDDYFGEGLPRGGFPTPNESSLRTGLTPGGSGSMFPEPSPSASGQGLFGLVASANPTPTSNPMDFQRNSINNSINSALHQTRSNMHNTHQNATSQPVDMHTSNGMDVKPAVFDEQQQHAEDAANGLFLLASTGARAPMGNHNPYGMAPSMAVHSHPQPAMSMGGNSHEAALNGNHRRNGNGSMSTASVRSPSVEGDDIDQKPNTRGKGKRNSAQMTNGNGKGKGPANKKAKGNNSRAMMEPEPADEEQEELDMSKEEYNANGKKMTDEEKRKNFLERNRYDARNINQFYSNAFRVAALKCRQRKKQWLANLQQKVEIFSTENDALSQQIGALRDEVVNLKTLLMAHKDCPITAAQGMQGMVAQLQLESGYNQPMNHNPYGMAGMNGQQQQQIMNGQQIAAQQRRFS